MSESDGQQRMSLLVRNLSYQTSPEIVRAHKLEGMHAREDIIVEGGAYVYTSEFWHRADAERALERMDGFELDGKCIEVAIAKKGRSAPQQMKQRDERGRREGSPRGRRYDDDRRFSRVDSPPRRGRYNSLDREERNGRDYRDRGDRAGWWGSCDRRDRDRDSLGRGHRGGALRDDYREPRRRGGRSRSRSRSRSPRRSPSYSEDSRGRP